MKLEALLLAPLLLALAGCYAPLRIGGEERAVALYREGRAPSGALAIHPEGRARTAERRVANATAAAPLVLTIDEAIARARENSPRVAELEARADAAAAATEAAGQYRNPELLVNQARLDQLVDRKPNVKLALRFYPHRPGEVDAKVAEARAADAAARAEARAAELALEADVRWMFDDVSLLDAEIAAAERVASARRSLAAKMKERSGIAEATALDETMAELFAVEAEQDGAERRVRRTAALAELLDRLGLDPSTPVRLDGDPMSAWPPPPLPSERTLVEAALRGNPRIGIAAAHIDGADARVYLERAKQYPWFTSIDAGYEFGPNTTSGLAWTVQAAIEVPIFNTNGGGVRAAQGTLAAERRALATEADRVARDVRARVREVNAAAALVTEFRERALPAIERADAQAKRALDNRGIDVVRALVVDERRTLVEVRFLRLIRRHRTALAELRRAVGNRWPDG